MSKSKGGMRCPHCKKQLEGVEWTVQQLTPVMEVYIFLCPRCRCVLGIQAPRSKSPLKMQEV